MVKILLNKRVLLLAASLFFGLLVVWTGAFLGWSPFSANLTFVVLLIFFLGIMVSSQQYEEDAISKVERIISSFLFSYILFFRLLYAPLSKFFFGYLIRETSFLADTLALILFLLFFFLFGTAFLVLNSYSRLGFLGHWKFFNNPAAFFILRFFFVAFLGIFAMIYIRNSFFSLKNSYYINKIIPPSTCGWTYSRFSGVLSLDRSVSGENICLLLFAKDRNDLKYCSLILDEEVKSKCIENVSSGSKKTD
ncbi:MAG: hypothetical protein WC831_00285 [Parcubacteria group bacterium]|jgi:hypothetical protein